jgi:CRISPR/Cas system CMR subunit Cmr6 (Cas7 group RAMP superfamily)
VIKEIIMQRSKANHMFLSFAFQVDEKKIVAKRLRKVMRSRNSTFHRSISNRDSLLPSLCCREREVLVIYMCHISPDMDLVKVSR